MRLILAALVAVFSLTACQGTRTLAEIDRLEAATVRISAGNYFGSGVVIAPRIVLSVAHIPISGEADIEFSDGTHATAERVWTDDPATLDVAVFKLDRDAEEIATLSCAPLTVNQQLVAIGHPYMARWVWSTLQVSTSRPLYEGDIAVAVQGPLIPGMSGGPIFNRAGELVGLAQSFYGEQIMGFTGPATIPNGLSAVVPASLICKGLPAEYMPATAEVPAGRS